MSNGTKGIPENSSVVMPRLYCHDVRAEMEFCKAVFGAVELNCRPGPDGKAAHALLTIGPAMIMIEAEWPGFASRPPVPDGSSPVVIFVYVEDVDAAIERAVAGRAFRGRVARVLAPARATSKPGLLSFNVAGLVTLVQVFGYVRIHLHTAEIQFVTKMLSKRLG